MSDCDETLEELHRFLDRELPTEIVDGIMGHLGVCTDCLQAYEFHTELRAVIAKKARTDEMPADLMDKIRACFGDTLLTEQAE
jgi:mycothiol system anti-sigma-R factor